VRALKHADVRFLQQCRACAITASDYPFNTGRLGVRSLAVAFKDEALGRGTRPGAGGAQTERPPGSRPPDPVPAAQHPLHVVEFDGHRLDLRLTLVMQDPLGYEQRFEVERAWLLVVLDVCTRCVLGYHLCFEPEYRRYDVIKTLENALRPYARRPLTIEGLVYAKGAALPSAVLPELGYAVWQWIKLDNAKANLASQTRQALCEFIGCFIDAGPAHQPNERPYVERFFGTLASTMSSRLPGYTGSHPRDLRRALADPKGDLRLFVSTDELVQLIDVTLANYNATAHDGLNARTPLEAMTYHLRTRAQPLTWLPESKRRALCLMQTARKCVVRGYVEQGTRPHINLFAVRYSSRDLAASTYLLGKPLRVYYNADDLRAVRAFLPDGAELGELKAQGAWGEIAHDLKLRREIIKLRGTKRMAHALSADVIDKFVNSPSQGAWSLRLGLPPLWRAPLRLLPSAAQPPEKQQP
jgi:transposase InsO family protein